MILIIEHTKVRSTISWQQPDFLRLVLPPLQEFSLCSHGVVPVKLQAMVSNFMSECPTADGTKSERQYSSCITHTIIRAHFNSHSYECRQVKYTEYIEFSLCHPSASHALPNVDNHKWNSPNSLQLQQFTLVHST